MNNEQKAYEILRSRFRGKSRDSFIAQIEAALGVNRREATRLARAAHRRFYTQEGGLPDFLGPEPEWLRADAEDSDAPATA